MSVYFQMKFVTEKVLEKQKAIVFFCFPLIILKPMLKHTSMVMVPCVP